MNQESDRTETLWRISAALAPTIQLAARCTWLTAVCTVGSFWILHGIRRLGTYRPEAESQWSKLERSEYWLLGTGAAVNTMYLLRKIWTDPNEGKWVPVILMLLAVVSLIKTGEDIKNGGVLLLYFTGAMLGIILATLMPAMRGENLSNPWGKKNLVHGIELLTVMLLSEIAWEDRKENGKESKGWITIGIIAVGTAVISQGVLYTSRTGNEREAFFEMTRSIRFKGKMLYLESFLIIGMLLGQYIWLTYLVGMIIERLGKEKKTLIVVLSVAVVILIYGMGYTVESGTLCAGTILIYSVMPMLKKYGKRKKKIVDKQ